jgi:hypothetical protein
MLGLVEMIVNSEISMANPKKTFVFPSEWPLVQKFS